MKYNLNSLVAIIHTSKSNAAGNSKRLYTPALDPLIGHPACILFGSKVIAKKHQLINPYTSL